MEEQRNEIPFYHENFHGKKNYLQNYRENLAVILKVKNPFHGNLTRISR